MKIALFAGGMGVGGVTTYVLDLGRYLLDAGHQITVVACEPGAWWPRLAERRIPGALLPPGRWESTAQHVRRLARHFGAGGYDVVFLNNGLGVRPAMLGLHRWPDSIAAIPVLHNDLARVYAHAQINRAAWNIAVAVSPKVGRTAAALMPDKRIETILYGIAMPTAQQLAARAAWELPLRLLFVGSLVDAHKGVLRLPAILAGCRAGAIPVRLTIIGAGPDRERLEADFTRQGVIDCVELRGQQPLEAVHQAMRDHHLLLMPSNYEGLPMVSLEAQANGCVPVASYLPGIMDLAVEAGVSGYLVGADDIAGYVASIAKLADERCWSACSQAAVKRAADLFSVSVMGARYLELLEQVAAGDYRLPVPRSLLREQDAPPLSPKDLLPGVLRSWAARLRRQVSGMRGGKR
jgi:glycosyltransferase involved in cell wall biosynthesis